MNDRSKDPRTKGQLLEELEQLQRRLQEAEETLAAIRSADVDAVVVAGPRGEQLYSLAGAEHIYRVIVETMNEAALMVDPDGTILFCNQRFCDLMKIPIQEAMGRKVTAFAARPQQPPLKTLLADAQGGPVQRHLTLRATDDTQIPVQFAASPLQGGDRLSLCLVASDLTELEASANSIRVLREHQQALEESEARFRTIFEASQDAIVIVDDAGTCVQANPAVAAVLGEVPEALIGRQISDFLSEALDFPAFWQAFLAAGSYRGELQLTNAQAQTRDVDVYAVANVLPGRHMWVLRDITERKQAQMALEQANEQLQMQAEELEEQTEELRVQTEELAAAEAISRESERRYRELVQNANSAIIRWARDGTVTFFNEYAQSFFGYKEEEAIGKHVSFLVPQRESTGADLTQLVHDVVEHPERYTNHVNENVCRDGHRVWMTWTNRPICDESGQVAEILAVGTDITERKHAEEALRELTRTLESKVTERTAELQHRARQLQKLTLELSQTEDRERRQLAEILHDDLQQMLAAAKFHLDLLNNRAKHDPAQQAIITHVSQMLLDAIQKSRSLSHELSPAALYQGTLTDALVWLANQIQTKHGLVVRVNTTGKVDAQADGIKTFLYKAAQELLFNVVKHARVNEARLRVRRLGQCICLSVSDRGRGFDPKEVRQAAGFGLLSIRERVELLGGRMRMHSLKGKGSTFYIAVPDTEGVTRGRTPAVREEKLPAGSQPPLRVLLADDHEIVREGLISLLADEHDIQVVGEAANGREAIDQAYRLRPDVVIMDVAMPLINGDDATRQIKMHLPQTRVIALSMYEEADMIEKMRWAGAEGYILKTAPAEQLLAVIRGKR